MKIKEGKDADYSKYKAMNSNNSYSLGVVNYTERWAQAMEKQLFEGKAIEEMADQTSHDADTEGITGFMYGCAVLALSEFWEHGEELRRWHNLKTQIRDEGEKANASGAVLNPAVLIIDTPPE